MIKDVDSSAWQPIDQESNIIYQYLHRCAAIQSPPAVIKEFKSLFIQGRNDNIEISQALKKIILSPLGKQQFEAILSNCCYLILNCWSNTPESLSYVSELINTFDTIHQVTSVDRRRKQLIQLIKNYQQTQSYFKLRAIIAIINPQEIANVTSTNAIATNEASSSSNTNKIINTYLTRYNYLYQFFLPQASEFNQLRELVKTLQNKRKQDFEFRLSQHLIYLVRLKQTAKMKLLSRGAGKVITKANNPTLLSERAFKIALKQYIAKVEDQATILQRSQHFVANNNLRNSYQVFKQDLYNFLITNIKPRNSHCQFSSELQQKIDQIFPQSDTKPLNNTLILQTCRQLLSFLIIDPSSPTDPNKFAELVVNLGTAQAMMILIKITLICPESKVDLEKKIALIVTYYQLHSIQDIPWLMKSLEHLLIAFGIYFGKIDVSIAKHIN